MISRRTALAGLGLLTSGSVIALNPFKELLAMPVTTRMPVLFVGHGSPMSAIEENVWTAAWRKMGNDIGNKTPRPTAILAISAHWITRGGLLVTASAHPPMTYDMGGFPAEIYQYKYPSAGDPKLAKDIQDTLTPTIPVHGDTAWGYDHGTWVVLKHMFPKADIPVIQLSLDYSKAPSFHYELAKKLQPLRDRGVLILCSGNIVHNLSRMIRTETVPFDWAVDFDQRINTYIKDGNHQAVVDFQKLGSLASMAHPTYDHFLPLLVALGVQFKGEEIRSFCDGFQYKSVSMRSFRIG